MLFFSVRHSIIPRFQSIAAEKWTTTIQLLNFKPFFCDKIPHWNTHDRTFWLLFISRCFGRVYFYFDRKRNVMKPICEQKYFLFLNRRLWKQAFHWKIHVRECVAASIVLYFVGMTLYHAIIMTTYSLALCGAQMHHIRSDILSTHLKL